MRKYRGPEKSPTTHPELTGARLLPETKRSLQAIPNSEVWIENKIPLSWIASTLLAKIKEPAPDKNTFAGRHYWAVLKAHEKRK